MVKFLATAKGGKLMLGLGITERNIEELKKGNAMKIELDEVALESKLDLSKVDFVYVFYGKDEDTIYEAFRKQGLVSSDTIVVDKS